MTDKILNRSDIDIGDTWDLSHLFKDDEAFLKEYNEVSKLLVKAGDFKDGLCDNAENLLNFFRFSDEISKRISALYTYANCNSDTDLENGRYIDLRGKAVSLSTDFSAQISFAKSMITGLDDSVLESFYESCPALLEYKRSIFSIKRAKEHILSENEERLLASLGEVADAPDFIAGVFRDADLTFPDATDSVGKTHPLNSGTLVPLLQSEDRALRKSAYDNYYKTLGGFKNTLAATLDTQFKTLKFYAKARKYSSTLEASLFKNEVPVLVYDNLISAVHKSLSSMYRYVSLRKRVLGVDTLCMYDVYTPIVQNCEFECPFADAKATVLEALAVLGEDYTDILKEGFSERWIDVYQTKSKRSGAYCTGGANPHPYVLLNHHGDLDSLFTLAHEMGHALHSYLSFKNMPYSNSHYVIFVAEVASTVNEILLMRHLLKQCTDKTKRAYLINHFLDQFKGTVFRQTMFAEFEKKMGALTQSGAALTADTLNEEYLKLNRLYFGDDMLSDENIALEWARIPHFYYDYYVFQYATGFSAAVAIADRILTEGPSAANDYKRFLSSGSSLPPIELLKIAGVDLSTPEPITRALKVFDDLVKELDTLI